jgi:hypothetical protein
MPSMHDTPLIIKQTLDTDPEINFINWELNDQDVAAATGRTIAGTQLCAITYTNVLATFQ